MLDFTNATMHLTCFDAYCKYIDVCVYGRHVIKNKCIFFVVVCTQGTFRPPGHSWSLPLCSGRSGSWLLSQECSVQKLEEKTMFWRGGSPQLEECSFYYRVKTWGWMQWACKIKRKALDPRSHFRCVCKERPLQFLEGPTLTFGKCPVPRRTADNINVCETRERLI